MEDVFLKHNLLLESILDGSSEPGELPISLLEHMTDNFSDERVAGKGGYGVVYKGEFKKWTVAVKKLIFDGEDDKYFDREIDSLMRVSHKNIVRFLGYCNNIRGTFVNLANPGEPERRSSVYKQERLLCFEFINNGSLTDHIHDELRGLEWHTRYKIIKEICQALNYLHNKQNLVHRDLKPDNILLDTLWVPKIADLGIAKLLGDGKTHTQTTDARSSMGYAAPEFRDCVVSYKYDIYSLGVIIIEIVTGVTNKPDVKNVLTRWRHRWNKSNETLIYQQVAKCIEIGMLCKNDKPRKRPSISKIMKDLSDIDGGNRAAGQDTLCWNSLLWVEPPELFFPFEINKQISSSLELHNEADAYMAFFIRTDSDIQYHVHPNKGLMQPRSHLIVNITLLAQEDAPEINWNAAEFTIKSKKVNEALTSEDISEDIFRRKLGNIADKVRIGVFFDAKLKAPCCISEESKKYPPLALLEIRGSQETSETSTEAESSTHSLSDSDKKVINFQDKHDNKEATNSDDSTLQSGNKNVKVGDEEPTIAPPNSDTGTRSATTTEPGRLVHLAIKSNNNAPLLRYNKRVMLELTGGDYTGDRPGLDLVAVLNVSTSVSYEMMEHMKSAMRFVVRKLSPMDRLSVVTFSYEARRRCPLRKITESSRQKMLELIDGTEIEDFETARVKDGLVRALEVLAKRKVRDGRTAAIILVCADLKTIQQVTDVRVGDVPVHTFGFGPSWDNHELLSNLAANSMGGTFSEIQINRGGDLTKAFSQCLAGLLTVSVQDLELTVAAVEEESRVVETSAGSYPQTQHKDGRGSSVTLVRFGSLYSSEVRRVILDLLLPEIDSERTADILKVTCSYRYNSRSSGSWQQLVAPPETLTVWRTAVDMEEEEEKRAVELQMEEARLQTVKIVKETIALFADYHSRLAYRKLEEAQRMLVEQSDVLLRYELQQLLELRDTRDVYIWYGLPYARSLLSSHDQQRFTARGDVDKMRLFATPHMDMYLEQANKFLSNPAMSLPSSVDDDVTKEEKV